MQKPAKTFADYLVIAISPVLIMFLVGSLAFFVIQVFYRGEMVHGVRWVMFWFVLAIVLVSRIGIEQSKEHAIGYGAALAVAMWIYLAYERAMPALGLVLLAVTWWCAHKLTVDCTLIDDDQDASGESVIQNLWRQVEQSMAPPNPLPPAKLSPLKSPALAELVKRQRRDKAQTPGRWVIYFSLAALPLFGLGQLLLPAGNPEARRAGFEFLCVYLAAALSLLITTSFLGLRRYLRQRSVEMSTTIALGWVRFGIILGGLVLIVALLLPRPGALNTWKTLTYQISHKTHKASDYALPFNPAGEGDGRPASQQPIRDQPVSHSAKNGSGSGSQPAQDNGRSQSPPDPNAAQSAGAGQSGGKSDTGQGSQSSEDGRAAGNNPSGDSDQSGGNGQSTGEDGSSDGQGQGAAQRPANSAHEHSQAGKDSQQKAPVEKKREVTQQPQGAPGARHTTFQPLLRVLLIIALVALFIWLVIRYRKEIAQAIRTFVAAVREFFRKLFSPRRRKPARVKDTAPPPLVLEPFAAYENPFVTGKDKSWPPGRIVLYTYEAMLAWAKEQHIEMKPQETPREFCNRLSEHYPEFGPELERFSYFYAHAAFAQQLPADFEPEPIRRLWQYLGDSVMAVSSR